MEWAEDVLIPERTMLILDRREFMQASALAAAAALSPPVAAEAEQAKQIPAREFYVALDGNDQDDGSLHKPFATLERAREVVRAIKGKPITVWVREGTYYLQQPLVFAPEDSGTAAAPITYAAYRDELVTLSGGCRLDCRWEPYRDGILRCPLSAVKSGELRFTQLFLNGNNQAEEEFQNNIIKNVKRTQPALRACGGVSALLGAIIVGMYTWQAWQRLHF